MSNVSISPEAIRDLNDIGRYIARDNPDQAIGYLRKLRTKIEKIAANPTIYSKRDELHPGLRSAPHQRYIIFFHIPRNDHVQILRIIHGSRDIASLLQE